MKEWCGDQIWAPSCYYGSVGSGWDVVEKYMLAHNYIQHNIRESCKINIIKIKDKNDVCVD